MLSKQVKERIRKNKQRRFQCRKKQGRELHRAMRRARNSPSDFFKNIWAGANKNNRFFEFDKLKDMPISTGFKQFNDILKGGGFKRGELPLFGAFMTPPLEPYKSDFRGYLISQAIKHGKPIRISLERDDLLDSEFTSKLYHDVKVGGLNTHNSIDNEIIIGLDPGVKEGDRTMTVAFGKRRAALKGGIFDTKVCFSKINLDEAHLAGDVQAEGRKQDVFDMLALAAKAVIEPQMYRKPDGSLELMSFGLVPAPELTVGPSKAPPLPVEMTGVQPLMPEANAELAATLDKFKDVKLNEAESQQLHEIMENPPAPNQKLKDAMARFREGVKDGTIKTITIDSYSDFKGSDDANRTRAVISNVP